VLPGFQRLFSPKAVKMPEGKKESHRTGRIGWLRAAVLGAIDGILSTSSLLLGVAAAQPSCRMCFPRAFPASLPNNMQDGEKGDRDHCTGHSRNLATGKHTEDLC